jgi:hypothetical protein
VKFKQPEQHCDLRSSKHMHEKVSFLLRFFFALAQASQRGKRNDLTISHHFTKSAKISDEMV